MDIDRIKKKYDELNKRREQRGRDFWNQKAGPNEIRVLPSWTGDPSADFYYETAYHRNLGADKKKNCVCLKAEGKDSCPICDVVKELYTTNDKENAAWAKEISARPRVYWNIVDLDEYHEAKKNKKEPKGVQIMATGPDVLHQFLGYCVNPKFGDLTDPLKGRNITLIFTKGEDSKTGFNDYVVQPDPDRTELEDIHWLEHLADLQAIVKPIEPEKMTAMVNGEEVADEKPVDSSGSEVKSEPEKPAEKEKAKAEPKSCMGKYSSDDDDCIACADKDPCQEQRKQAKTKPEPAPQTAPVEASSGAEPKEEPKSASTDKATEVQNMMLKIREKQLAAKKKQETK